MLALIAASTLIAVAWLIPSRQAPTADIGTPVPLTSDPGTELELALSPDGKRVAYVWDGAAHDNFDVYVRMVPSGPPVRLTTNPADDYSPAWSPDGVWIAFLRQNGSSNASVFIVPALGGKEKMITSFAAGLWPQWHRPGPFLTWSRDGKWLVAVGRREAASSDRLLRISTATGETRSITSPLAGETGDLAPAVSPDGKMLAFSRRRSWGVADLCVLPVSQELLPLQEATPLSTGSPWNTSPAWAPDGKALVFSTGRIDAPHLRRIGMPGASRAELLTDAGDYGWQPSLDPHGTERNHRCAPSQPPEALRASRTSRHKCRRGDSQMMATAASEPKACGVKNFAGWNYRRKALAPQKHWYKTISPICKLLNLNRRSEGDNRSAVSAERPRLQPPGPTRTLLVIADE